MQPARVVLASERIIANIKSSCLIINKKQLNRANKWRYQSNVCERELFTIFCTESRELWWSGFQKLCDESSNHSLCRPANLQRRYSTPRIEFLSPCVPIGWRVALFRLGWGCRRRPWKRSTWGSLVDISSIGGPLGGHSINLVGSWPITKFVWEHVAPGLFLVCLRGFEHLAFTLLPNH